jgi:endogenous inhibitor of DNA gyrase (YacG/DUF329 family)
LSFPCPLKHNLTCMRCWVAVGISLVQSGPRFGRRAPVLVSMGSHTGGHGIRLGRSEYRTRLWQAGFCSGSCRDPGLAGWLAGRPAVWLAAWLAGWFAIRNPGVAKTGSWRCQNGIPAPPKRDPVHQNGIPNAPKQDPVHQNGIPCTKTGSVPTRGPIPSQYPPNTTPPTYIPPPHTLPRPATL